MKKIYTSPISLTFTTADDFCQLRTVSPSKPVKIQEGNIEDFQNGNNGDGSDEADEGWS